MYDCLFLKWTREILDGSVRIPDTTVLPILILAYYIRWGYKVSCYGRRCDGATKTIARVQNVQRRGDRKLSPLLQLNLPGNSHGYVVYIVGPGTQEAPRNSDAQIVRACHRDSRVGQMIGACGSTRADERIRTGHSEYFIRACTRR